MPKVKKAVKVSEIPKLPEAMVVKEKTQKEIYLELYQTLKDLNIRSISDLENLIARSE